MKGTVVDEGGGVKAELVGDGGAVVSRGGSGDEIIAGVDVATGQEVRVGKMFVDAIVAVGEPFPSPSRVRVEVGVNESTVS